MHRLDKQNDLDNRPCEQEEEWFRIAKLTKSAFRDSKPTVINQVRSVSFADAGSGDKQMGIAAEDVTKWVRENTAVGKEPLRLIRTKNNNQSRGTWRYVTSDFDLDTRTKESLVVRDWPVATH